MKRLTRFGIGLAVIAAVPLVVLAVTAGDGGEQALPEYWPAPAFSLVDQTGAPLSRNDLLGTPWVASFIFTNCADVCPTISARMARLADDLRREGLLGERVRLVSFTVDPERDTPQVLEAYARGFGGLPPAEWAFLTGQPGDSMRAMVQEGFRLTAMLPASAMPAAAETAGHAAHEPAAPPRDAGPQQRPVASYQVMHAPRVLLVDGAGVVRGIYDATEPEAMDRVVDDARRLLES